MTPLNFFFRCLLVLLVTTSALKGGNQASGQSEQDRFLKSNRSCCHVVTAGQHWNQANSYDVKACWDSLTTLEKTVVVLGAFALTVRGGVAINECLHDGEDDGVSVTGNDNITGPANNTASNQISDDVTNAMTETNLLAQDQRSFLKQWADTFRNREHLNSIYQDADQIDYIEGKDPEPADRTRFQNLIRWMTQSFYAYQNVEDFKQRNHSYKIIAAKDETIVQHQTAIANHPAATQLVEHLATIENLQLTIQNHNQTQQQKEEAKDQARIARVTAFHKEAREERGVQVQGIKQLILEISKTASLCYSKPIVTAAQSSSSSVTPDKNNNNNNAQLQPKTPSKSALNSTLVTPVATHTTVQETSLTPFQMLLEATQYLVIKKLQHVEKVAQKSVNAEEAAKVAGKINDQCHEAWAADAELMEKLEKLMSKKEILWKCWAQGKNDFVTLQSVTASITSISSKIPELSKSITTSSNTIKRCFNAVKQSFDADESTNAIQENSDRGSIINVSSNSGEKTKKNKSFLSHLSFNSSSGNKETQASRVAVDLQIETTCRELATRIKNQFSLTVIPVNDRIEKIFTQSYELLHLAEGNALLGHQLMRLYEADQGRKLWETSVLRPYLVTTLTQARNSIPRAIDLFTQEKQFLGGTWEKAEENNDPNYSYKKEGLEVCANENTLTNEIAKLKALSDSIKEEKVQHLNQAVENAKIISGLLATAQTKADEFLNPTSSNAETVREDFLGAMKILLEHAILRSEQL